MHQLFHLEVQEEPLPYGFRVYVPQETRELRRNLRYFVRSNTPVFRQWWLRMRAEEDLDIIYCLQSYLLFTELYYLLYMVEQSFFCWIILLHVYLFSHALYDYKIYMNIYEVILGNTLYVIIIAVTCVRCVVRTYLAIRLATSKYLWLQLLCTNR